MTLEEQFTRLIQILQLIEREPWKWDAEDLEQKFEVSRSTIERDIAILRTMGASRGMVLRIFMLSGASIGIVGTLAGLALGVAFTENIEAIRHFVEEILHVDLFSAEIRFFTRIPAQLNEGEVASVVLMALALSFLATLYPSWRAARLDPVEGLRYE